MVRRIEQHWRYSFLLPPFILGACLAVAAKVAVGLLLYGGVGFLRALSVILATLAGTLAFGLWAGRIVDPVGPTEAVRLRWLLTLVAFTGAVVFAGAWEYFGAFGVQPWSQALGLALLAGLPLFFGGSLLGVMTREDSVLHPPPDASRVSPGMAVILGVGAGFLATGFILFPRFSAPHLLLVCVVLLSAGALIHGWILDQVTVVKTVAVRTSHRGELQVEHRIRGRPRRVHRALLRNGRVVGLESENGSPELPEERAVWSLIQQLDGPRSALFVGAGALTLPRLLRRDRTECRVVVLEEDPLVTEMAYGHFEVDEGDGVEIHHGPPGWGGTEGLGEADLVAVSGSALEGDLPTPLRLQHLLPWLDSLLRPSGVVVAYGLALPEDGDRGLDHPYLEPLIGLQTGRLPFRRAFVKEDEVVVVLANRGLDLPDELEGFRMIGAAEGAAYREESAGAGAEDG